MQQNKYRCIYLRDMNNIQYCIECDLELLFIEWLCVECGCFSPQGDPCDPNIDIDGNELIPIGF